jgi:hypothetical protein
MAETKNVILRNKDGTESSVFTGPQPRQAALNLRFRVLRATDFKIWHQSEFGALRNYMPNYF